ADALRGARCRAQRAAHALLEAGVLEPVQLVAPAEARVDGRLLLRVFDRGRAFRKAAECRAQAAQRLPEGAVGAADAARLGAALDLDDVVFPGERAHQNTTSAVAVARTLRVASGRRIFQPND